MHFITITLASTLALASLALSGCAAETDPSETEGDAAELPTVQTDTTSPQYQPRVTMKDIVQGGGSCTADGVCRLSGIWQCGKGSTYCTLTER